MHSRLGQSMHSNINDMHIPVLLVELMSVPRILYEFPMKVCGRSAEVQPPSWMDENIWPRSGICVAS